MGGILGAEVAIMPTDPPSNQHPFQHNILGTINFDTPFLGMHPGIVFAGIGSLFRPFPEPPRPSQQTSQVDYQAGPYLSSSSSAAQSQLGSPERSQSILTERPDEVTLASTNVSSPHSGTQATLSPLLSPTTDPNYNPQYTNDVRVPERHGWEKVTNFLMKHSGDLRTATTTYVTSHLEFGGALADLKGLKNRYTVLRLLEDGMKINGNETRKVRFVNYYTASTGRPPKVNTATTESDTAKVAATEEALDDRNINSEGTMSMDEAEEQGPSKTGWELSKHSTLDSQQGVHGTANTISTETSALSDDDDLYGDGFGREQTTVLQNIEPKAETEPEASKKAELEKSLDALALPSLMSTEASSSSVSLSTVNSTSSLPPLGSMPQPPADVDLDSITNKDERKLVVKEYSRQMQAYQRAMKDREKTVKGRQKLLEKREKAVEKDRTKQLKQEAKTKAKADKDFKAEAKAIESLKLEKVVPSDGSKAEKAEKPPQLTTSENPTKDPKPPKEKPKKDRKFCMLPPKDGQGRDDKCWSRVFMKDVDEVGAHVTLFFADRPHYVGLVFDVGNRIREWVVEARALHEERLLATQDFGRWREKR